MRARIGEPAADSPPVVTGGRLSISVAVLVVTGGLVAPTPLRVCPTRARISAAAHVAALGSTSRGGPGLIRGPRGPLRTPVGHSLVPDHAGSPGRSWWLVARASRLDAPGSSSCLQQGWVFGHATNGQLDQPGTSAGRKGRFHSSPRHMQSSYSSLDKEVNETALSTPGRADRAVCHQPTATKSVAVLVRTMPLNVSTPSRLTRSTPGMVARRSLNWCLLRPLRCCWPHHAL